jgi:hypothetical protein
MDLIKLIMFRLHSSLTSCLLERYQYLLRHTKLQGSHDSIWGTKGLPYLRPRCIGAERPRTHMQSVYCGTGPSSDSPLLSGVCPPPSPLHYPLTITGHVSATFITAFFRGTSTYGGKELTTGIPLLSGVCPPPSSPHH